MFQITLLPVSYGDSLWVEYGDPQHPRRVLIDGGPIGCYDPLEERINALPDGEKCLELTVITHVDEDHIAGIIRLIAEKNRAITFKDIWFNGWKHLTPEPEILGAMQGEFLSALIHHKLTDRKWNAAKPFQGKAIEVPDGNTLPVSTFADGLKLTLLSPTQAKLDKLRKDWKRTVPHDFTPGDLEEALKRLLEQKRLTPNGILGGGRRMDEAEPAAKLTANNESSIAFLAEFEGKSCLFLGDASPRVVEASVRLLLKERNRDKLAVDVVKVSHHGSHNNTTKSLLKIIDCKKFCVSTNGKKFDHPHPVAIEKIIDTAGPDVELYFNYRSDTTQAWSNKTLQKSKHYTAHYPAAGQEGITVTL